MYRVTYYGMSKFENDTCLLDKKFNTESDVLAFIIKANIADENLNFMQEFKDDGTPIRTVNKEDLIKLVTDLRIKLENPEVDPDELSNTTGGETDAE